MIPLKLELTNFLSYRETAVVDFSGIHLACISGANGAGKSTLLDAIIWVLFGQSRSRSDDDLVNRVAALDGTAAEVRLTFDLEGGTYRVTRQKAPRKTTVLELQMAAGDDKWKSLSESKLRETQAAIEALLRMNYDTFINASFLLQGKADEFTTKTPNRRKEILADLLGVNQWDQHKEVAANQRRAIEQQIAVIDGQLAELDVELAEEDTRADTLTAAKAELAQIAERLADKEALLQKARQVATAVSQQQKTIHDLNNRLEQAQRRLTQAIQNRDRRQQQMADYQAILDEADAIAAAFAAFQEADAALQDWQQKADEHNRLQQQKRPYELAITQARTRLEQRQQELERQASAAAAAATERTINAAREKEHRQELDALIIELAQMETQEQALQEARTELHNLTSKRSLVQQELAQLQTQAQRIQKMVGEQTAVSQNQTEAVAALAQVTAELSTMTARQQRHATALAEIDGLKATQNRLRAEMDRHKTRIDQLEAESGSSCPLCGQALTADHRAAVLEELRSEGSDMGDEFRLNKERVVALQAETAELAASLKQRDRLERDRITQQERQARAEARLSEIQNAIAEWGDVGEKQLRELEKQVQQGDEIIRAQQTVAQLEQALLHKKQRERDRQQLQNAVSKIGARLDELDRLIQDWEKVGKAELAEVAAQLAKADYAAEAQAALADLEAALAAVGYDAPAHEAAKTKRESLAAAQQRQQQLQEVRAAVAPLAESLADVEKQISEDEALVADLTTQQETAVAHLQALTADADDLPAIEEAVQQLREQRIAADRRVGAAQQRLDVLTDVRARQQDLRDKRASQTQQVQRLKLLEQACGRDGVQALLIEQALPEIEEHANELLDRLTDGVMRVSFETQRQLKSRDAVAETLDIRISDNAGERPYDNYSGGEQFRVNFAIRLALSQLLARRAGARLQTLVIDEGFGSQDPQGRQRLVEAINNIQDDFRRILVITHVAELRDAFPNRIEVVKHPLGSAVSVI